jgi:hypothetical protein
MAGEGTKRGTKDTPGGAYKKNFNRNPSGKFNIRMKRGKMSRSKSSRG